MDDHYHGLIDKVVNESYEIFKRYEKIIKEYNVLLKEFNPNGKQL